MMATCVVADTKIVRPTHLCIHTSRLYGMLERMLIGPRLVDRRKTSGICTTVIQAALNAISSTKCAVEVGASTDSSRVKDTPAYAMSTRMLPIGRVTKFKLSSRGKGATATARMYPQMRLGIPVLSDDRAWKLGARGLRGIRFYDLLQRCSPTYVLRLHRKYMFRPKVTSTNIAMQDQTIQKMRWLARPRCSR